MPFNKNDNEQLKNIRKNIINKYKKIFRKKGYIVDKKNWFFIKEGYIKKKYPNRKYKEIKEKIRRLFQYRQWRSDIFQRDNFTCQNCGKKGIYLEAHHIKSFIKILDEYKIKTLEQALNCDELWNINNGISFCRDCHLRTRKHTNETKKRISKAMKKLKSDSGDNSKPK